MGDKSKIEWTEATWNPVTGCSKVSPGCAHCYAETLALNRLAGKPGYSGLPWTPENAAENVVLRPERLDQPLKWTRPRMIFVNSMSDLFHPQVPAAYIAEVFAVMALARHHTFQVLTKRPDRMLEVFRAEYEEGYGFDDLAEESAVNIAGDRALSLKWPLPNVWLGVSIENRRYVHRADLLRETPAAVRFISAEPLLGPLVPKLPLKGGALRPVRRELEKHDWGALDLTDIDWLIVGGESGPKHRPMRAEWARDLKAACLAQAPCTCRPGMDGGGVYHAGDCRSRERRTAFFFKQWGGRTPKAGGRLLDGRTWDEMPVAPAVPA